MPSGSAIRAGRAFVELFLDDSRLQRGLKSAAQRIQAFGAQVTRIGRGLLTAGAAVTGPLLAAAKHFASSGDQLQKMAARTGASVEALSELKFAAEQSGSSIDVVEKGIKGINRTLYDAERGLSTATDALDDIGVSLDQLQGLSPEDQFTLIADRLSAIDDEGRRSALAMKLFGARAGHDLIPLLKSGANGMSALREEARRLGIVMSTEDADAAADFTDAMHEVWEQLKALIFQIGAPVAQALTGMLRRSQQIIAVVIDWAKQNRQLVLTLAKVFAAITAAGGALVVFGLTIQAVGPALRFLGLTMKFLFTATNKWVLALKAALLLLAGIAILVPAVREKLTELGGFLLEQAGLKDLFDKLNDVLGLPELPDGVNLDAPDLSQFLNNIGQIQGGAAFAAGGGASTLGTFTGDPRQFGGGRARGIEQRLDRIFEEMRGMRRAVEEGMEVQ